MTGDEKAALDNLSASTDPQARYGAIIAIGKSSLTNLATAVEPYLHDRDPELRSAAIRTLAFYWRLPQFRPVAEKMMREEPDELTRSVAVMGWAGYDLASKNRDTLRRLYQIIIDDTETSPVRDQADLNFFAVFLPSPVGRPKSAYHVGKRFEDGVDWARLDSAMKDVGADLATDASLRRVSSVASRDPLTTVTLSRGRFEVVCDQRRVDGSLNDETWSRAVGLSSWPTFPSTRSNPRPT